jgi:hypothetical protein
LYSHYVKGKKIFHPYCHSERSEESRDYRDASCLSMTNTTYNRSSINSLLFFISVLNTLSSVLKGTCF